MRPNPSSLVRNLGTVVVVVVLSIAGGVGLGTVLSKVNGNDDGGNADPRTAPASPTATATPTPASTAATGPTASPSAEPRTPAIRVLSSTFVPATRPLGRQRRRARVAVRLRVTARGEEATLGTALLVSGDEELEADANATGAAGDLLEPIAAGESATGQLRFETAGALTDTLADELRATLRVGGRSLPLRLRTP